MQKQFLAHINYGIASYRGAKRNYGAWGIKYKWGSLYKVKFDVEFIVQSTTISMRSMLMLKNTPTESTIWITDFATMTMKRKIVLSQKSITSNTHFKNHSNEKCELSCTHD